MTKRKMDGGEKAFCEGVKQLGDRVNPGLGDFIQQCVKKAMEERGLTYQETTKPQTRKRSK